MTDSHYEPLRPLRVERGPGPEERKLLNRLSCKVFGRWPDRVVNERLRLADARISEAKRAAATEQFGEDSREIG